MTREEAIERFSGIINAMSISVAQAKFYPTKAELDELCDMAIEALQTEPNKAVPPSLADVYKWERDIALSQLEEYGIGFAEKKRDDLVEVVRCKDCKFRRTENCAISSDMCLDAHDYCAFGERKDK